MKDYSKDTTFINSFIKGAIHTLKVQCSIDVVSHKPYILNPGEHSKMGFEIAGLIGITSSDFQGSIAICFPEKTFLAIMGKMLGDQFTEINKDLEDGAGELMNIVYGTAKSVLNDQGYTLQKALPSVIRGQKIRMRHAGTGTTLVLPFESDVGKFEIEIGVDFAQSKKAS